MLALFVVELLSSAKHLCTVHITVDGRDVALARQCAQNPGHVDLRRLMRDTVCAKQPKIGWQHRHTVSWTKSHQLQSHIGLKSTHDVLIIQAHVWIRSHHPAQSTLHKSWQPDGSRGLHVCAWCPGLCSSTHSNCHICLVALFILVCDDTGTYN